MTFPGPRRCEGCCFRNGDECRRYPPQVTLMGVSREPGYSPEKDYYGTQAWPLIVRDQDWCGEWTAL